MEEYKQDRKKQTGISRFTGIGLTVVVHAAVLSCACLSGMTYLDPPAPEREEIVIDFDEIEPEVKEKEKNWSRTRVKSPEPDRTRPDELVKMSKAQMTGTKQNVAQEATVGPDGDVEVNEPKREKEINRRALFHAADNHEAKDTLAPQTAREVSDELETGHASGNVLNGKVSGEPNARLKGRSVVGHLARPAYGSQKEGTVVVKIAVDQNGRVTDAIPGVEGTTVTDKSLWNAARNAAMTAKFSPTSDISKMKQYGTITYIFKLTK